PPPRPSPFQGEGALRPSCTKCDSPPVMGRDSRGAPERLQFSDSIVGSPAGVIHRPLQSFSALGRRLSSRSSCSLARGSGAPGAPGSLAIGSPRPALRSASLVHLLRDTPGRCFGPAPPDAPPRRFFTQPPHFLAWTGGHYPLT